MVIHRGMGQALRQDKLKARVLSRRRNEGLERFALGEMYKFILTLSVRRGIGIDAATNFQAR